ncbi:ABC transporter permease [Haloglomus litoreum]|uniref:ABC transporter permease n=1 Tax=Haloglomus litoreum TaxID=3034026 RepID=UPI0023E8EA90|nr:ABC transporter permease [Haloglomus sp. DT116]
MSLRTVLRKELLWSRHRVLALLFVLILLPAAFAGASVFFQHVLPKDAPVAVVAGEDVSDSEYDVVAASFRLFSKPIQYDSEAAAMRDLRRESVYAVVSVPPDLDDPEVEQVNMTVTIDGDVTPYREPSQALVSVVAGTMNRQLDKRVVVQREIAGEERKLSSYLLPTFLMIIVLTFAFAYLPYNLAREEAVLDRLRVETSLDTVVAAKLAFFTALLAVPLLVFHGIGVALGYGVNLLAPGAVLAYGLTFLACGAIATAVTFASGFGTTGRLFNVLVLFGFLGFSGLVYPVGFFSPLRREVIRLVPTHYAMLTVRGTALRGLPVTEFATWLAGIALFALAMLVPLKLSLLAYERGT